jgi:hypothetical protein
MASSSSRSGRDDAMALEDMSPALRGRLGAEASVGLVEYLDLTREEWAADVLSAAVDKFELRLTHEIGTLRHDIQRADAALRIEIRDACALLRQEMITQRVDLLKWSFLFWVGQAATTAAIVGGMLALIAR